MRKRFQFFTLFFLFMLGVTTQACELPERPQEEDSPLEHLTEERLSGLHEGDVEIITIDGCEYIIYEHAARYNQSFGFMAHKGNCKNPIHVYRTPGPPAHPPDTTDTVIKPGQ